MGNNADNVTYVKPKIGGAIHVAPLGTIVPTDVSSELSDAYECVGYISEDGYTNDNSPETGEVKAWGGDTVLNTQNGRPDTFKWKMIEVNESVLKVVYGEDNVVVGSNGNIAIHASTQELLGHVYVIDQMLKGGRARRTVIPNGNLIQLGTITNKDNEAIGYETTISAIPDANGYTHHEYIAGDSTPSYTVSFNTDGGSEIANQKVRSGNGAIQPASPTKEGNVFAGWYADSELTTVYVFGTPVTANTTIYAKWEAE